MSEKKNQCLTLRILMFCTLIILTGCGTKSNFGLNSSFFSGLNFFNKESDAINKNQKKSPAKKGAKKRDDNKSKAIKNKSISKSNNKSSIFKSIDHLDKMSISDIEKKFGDPSFVIYNTDIGDDKTSYYFMSWYYVTYEIEEDNITHNHTLNSSKSLIIRFDSSLHVVGAQLVENWKN